MNRLATQEQLERMEAQELEALNRKAERRVQQNKAHRLSTELEQERAKHENELAVRRLCA